MILPNNNDATSQSRLSRWFSVRRGSSVHQYDIENVENSFFQLRSSSMIDNIISSEINFEKQKVLQSF